ncbi:MAG: hypothetical protein U1F61_16410 [Opitutaceae bacterium]
MTVRPETRRNPGPRWGFAFLRWAERTWPRWFFRVALRAGNAVAVVALPERRRQSRAFLELAHGRRVGWGEVIRHFELFSEVLLLKLQVGHGRDVAYRLDPEHAQEFEALARSSRPALFGTFHVGASDLLGYRLSDWGRQVSILRLRVGNSDDTRLLGERFVKHVSFLWVNDPTSLLFDLKEAIERGVTLALKCDRIEFAARQEAFQFFGARRMFPFTIYHLAVLFDRPVAFCVALPGRDATRDPMRLHASCPYFPDPAASRAENLGAARAHFQGVLSELETLLRAEPRLWFNFIPLNPVAA